MTASDLWVVGVDRGNGEEFSVPQSRESLDGLIRKYAVKGKVYYCHLLHSHDVHVEVDPSWGSSRFLKGGEDGHGVSDLGEVTSAAAGSVKEKGEGEITKDDTVSIDDTKVSSGVGRRAAKPKKRRRTPSAV